MAYQSNKTKKQFKYWGEKESPKTKSVIRVRDLSPSITFLQKERLFFINIHLFRCTYTLNIIQFQQQQNNIALNVDFYVGFLNKSNFLFLFLISNCLFGDDLIFSSLGNKYGVSIKPSRCFGGRALVG